MEQNNYTDLPKPVEASKRLVSALIDYLPMMAFSIIANSIGMALFYEYFPMDTLVQQQNTMSDEEAFAFLRTMMDSMSVMFIPMCIAMALSYIYFLCKDVIGGRSLGKRLQKLQLVRSDGSPVSYTRMVVRNLFIVIWPIEVIMYLANKGQRLGDLLCKTTVVVATDENKQAVDKQKVIISILVTAIFSALIAMLYYWGMKAVFEWYISFIEKLVQQKHY